MLDQLEELADADADRGPRRSSRSTCGAPGRRWPRACSRASRRCAGSFVKVFPADYKRVLAERRASASPGIAAEMGDVGRLSWKIERSRSRLRRPEEGDGRARPHLQGVPRRRPDEELAAQGARCMECGVPFCHNGCPLGNLIPDWNDLVFRDRWRDAIRQLHATNNFPEFTGRLCPAPCEAACVLEIREGDAVTIKQIENSIIDRAWDEGWVVPRPPGAETGERGRRRRRRARPGMAAAQQLRRAGHRGHPVRARRGAGGLIRFGVPDFKIEKRVVDRRMEQLVAEGVELRCGVDVGVDVPSTSCASSSTPSCWRSARACRATCRSTAASSTACTSRWTTSTAARARCATPTARPARSAPRARRSSSSAAATPAPTASATRSARARESVVAARAAARAARRAPRRPHAVAAVAGEVPPQLRDGGGQGDRARRAGLLGRDDALRGRRARAAPALRQAAPAPPFAPVEGTEGVLEADLVLLAMGFLHPQHEGVVDGLGSRRTSAATSRAPTYATSVEASSPPATRAAGSR